MQSWRLDDLLSSKSDNTKLIEGLRLIQPRVTSGSLAMYDNFGFDELSRFRQIYNLKIEETIIRNEHYPGEMLSPKRMNVNLPDNVYKCLVDYYNNAYEVKFVTISELSTSTSDRPNVVMPRINQYGRIRIGAEIFGSDNFTKYSKNSFILAKFVQENDTVEMYPGQIQYFFEHEIRLSNKKHTYCLAYVRWFLPVHNHQIRFQCRIDNNDVRSCNIELWEYKFFDIARDSIIPVHNIYCRFIPAEFSVGSRKINNYMAVIPINRHFHM